MAKYVYNRNRIDKLSREEMLQELEKVAEKHGYEEFGWRDFNLIANISASPIKKEFGSWKNALSELKKILQNKGLDLYPRKVPPNRIHSNRDLFEEMERIWNILDHRPSKTEWGLLNPKISYNTYRQRFGGWREACLEFIEYKSSGIDSDDQKEDFVQTKANYQKKKYKQEDTRSIPLSIRLKVMERDNFRCVLCGRCPATDVGVKLHLDHIIPFSKGGKSTEENLQTLCQDCNLGKSDRIL